MNWILIIFEKIFSRKGLLAMIGLLLIVFLASIWNRYIQSDENWFGEQAYWFLKEGVVRLKSMPLVHNAHIRIYLFYKLFVYIGSGLIWLFGFNVWPLKLFTFATFILFLFIYKRHLSYIKSETGFLHWLLPVFFIVTTPLFLEQVIIFRPDVPLMLMGFSSFFFLYKFLKEDLIKYAFFAGLIAGSSFLIHLNGNVFAITGFLFLLSYKKFKGLLYFSVAAFATGILYLHDILSVEALTATINEFQNIPNPSADFSGNIIVSRLLGLLTEHQRFFWSTRVMATSVFMILSLLLFYKPIVKQVPTMMRFFVIQIVILNLFGGYVAERFLIYHLPYIAIIISIAVTQIIKNRRKFVAILFVLVMVFQISSISSSFNMVFSSNYNHTKTHKSVISHIPKGEKVLAPWNFVYNEIGNYRILSYKNIEYYNYKRVDTADLHMLINKMDINYIIVSDLLEAYAQIEFDTIKVNGIFNYYPIYSDKKYVILQKQ